jgi:Ran GTPase-activating protein (RanGAP) involved in mRNA processing and transport
MLTMIYLCTSTIGLLNLWDCMFYWSTVWACQHFSILSKAELESCQTTRYNYNPVSQLRLQFSSNTTFWSSAMSLLVRLERLHNRLTGWQMQSTCLVWCQHPAPTYIWWKNDSPSNVGLHSHCATGLKNN